MRIGSSLLLIAIGAILMWAIDITDSTYGSVTVDWSIVGAIILVAGFAGLIWAWYLTSEWHERAIADREAARRTVPTGMPPRDMPPRDRF